MSLWVRTSLRIITDSIRCIPGLFTTDTGDVFFQAGHDNVIPVDDGKFGLLMGVLPRNDNAFRFAPLKEVVNDANGDLPERFDARERWPECSSLLDTIKDQSNCGSCWVSISCTAQYSRTICNDAISYLSG